MKDKYLNKQGIQNKYSFKEKVINRASYLVGASGPIAALGTYLLDSTPENFTSEEAILYGALTLSTPIFAGIANKIALRINEKKKEKSLGKLEKQINKDIPLIVENPEMLKTKYSKSVPLNIGRN
jgi:hypothetical protein